MGRRRAVHFAPLRLADDVVPAHPGRYIDYHLMERRILEADTGRYRIITIIEAAREIGVSAQTLDKIRTGHTSITPRTCLLLAAWTGVCAETWAETQWRYDLWQEQKKLRKEQGS